MTLSRSRMSLLVTVVALATIIGGILASLALRGALPHVHVAKAASTPTHIDCAHSALCTEVQDPEEVFGEGNYIGHDEPSTLFYSDKPGAGNRMRYQLTLPSDPPAPGGVPTSPAESFNFQLHPAFWFGMAMCDTQSYPVQVSTCTPDSDSNIVDPAVSPKHPGTAFMELQFYPPGWVQWPASFFNVGGSSCDPTKWCAALNIDSLSEDPVAGKFNNPTCLAAAGLEYVNFAFVTKNGHATGPASPLLSTVAGTFTPDSTQDLFMNSGDRLVVTLHDTPNGLETDIQDLTTGQSGLMTASVANGFGEVKFDPTGTDCDPATHNIPTNFHPMYSTSSEQTRVIWAAHSYNIAFSDEIGHFDYCTGSTPIPPSEGGVSCPAGDNEGISTDLEPTDGDDNGCFPAPAAPSFQVSGCTDTNTGFDGVPYQPLWPDGNTALHPTPIIFTSPLTGPVYNTNYKRAAFEADLPRIEDPTVCHRLTDGSGCTLIPTTDDNHAPANFYPFYSIGSEKSADVQHTDNNHECIWMFGNDIPGMTTNDFGKNNQYGSLLPLVYLTFGGGGATNTRFNDFRQVFDKNPCKSERP